MLHLFFFTDTATTEIYTLSLHDALPISLLQTIANPQPTFNDFGGAVAAVGSDRMLVGAIFDPTGASDAGASFRSEEHTSELQSHSDLVCRLLLEKKKKTNPASNANTNRL